MNLIIHVFTEKCECVEVTLGSPKLFCGAEYDYGKCCLTEGIDSVLCEPVVAVKEGIRRYMRGTPTSFSGGLQHTHLSATKSHWNTL